MKVLSELFRERRGLLAGVLAAAIVGGAWWISRPPAVSAVRPARGDAAEVVYATGVVEPRNWAKVASLQRKRIVEICQCEGKIVRKGDVLARLDDVEERAAMVELQARRDRIREDAERLRGLYERNVTSRVAYDEKVTQLSEFEARISAQRDRILDLELRAPMDGVVLRRDGEVGEIAGTAANDVMFWIGQPKPLQIVAEVNEEDIARVARGQKVLLRHDGFPDGPLSASVGEITPKGDPSTKTFRVYFTLPDDTPLKVGMSVEANVVVREAKGVLLVPAEAVRSGRAWIVAGGRLASRDVTIGIRGARQIEVLSGLGEDQWVVAPVPANAKEGLRVRVNGGGR